MNRRWRLALVVGCVLTLWGVGSSTAQETKTNPADAAAYLDLIDSLQDEEVANQVDLLRTFLSDHPESSFRPEIETNLRRLEDLLTETDPKRRQEAREAERYLRAVEFAKKLSPQDQIALWEQFLEENPNSLYRNEALANLEELKSKHAPARKPLPPPTSTGLGTKEPVASTTPYKDIQTATLLATFPGLIVPGMGHWYTGENSTAGILTGFRVGAVALGIPGIVKNNTALIVIGSVMYVFTYLYDVIDTPFAVRRYNAQLDEASTRFFFRPELIPDLDGGVSVALSGKF